MSFATIILVCSPQPSHKAYSFWWYCSWSIRSWSELQSMRFARNSTGSSATRGLSYCNAFWKQYNHQHWCDSWKPRCQNGFVLSPCRSIQLCSLSRCPKPVVFLFKFLFNLIIDRSFSKKLWPPKSDISKRGINNLDIWLSDSNVIWPNLRSTHSHGLNDTLEFHVWLPYPCFRTNAVLQSENDQLRVQMDQRHDNQVPSNTINSNGKRQMSTHQ